MISEHKFLKMRDGVELHAQIKEKGSKVWIVASHGLGEHLGRHSYLNSLFGQDFNILQYDLRGHGRSSGERSYVSDFSMYMKDLEEVILFLQDQYKMNNYILFGHSMGALITAGYIQNYAKEEIYPSRVVLSGPPVGVHGVLGQVVKYSPLGLFNKLSKLPLTVKVGGLVDLNYLSHDSRVRQDYEADDLNALKIHTKLGIEIAKTAKSVFSRPLRPKCPAYCVYGTEDQIIGVSALEEYFHLVEKAFVVKAFNSAYHEIHNEIEKYRKPYFEYLKEVFYEALKS